MLRRQADKRAQRDVERVDAAFDVLSDPDAEAPKLEDFSDLTRSGQDRLRVRWLDLPAARRTELIQAMLAEAEADVARSFERVMVVALEDPEAANRAAAVDGLWESTDAELLSRLLTVLAREQSAAVRLQIVRLLGQYAMRAQLGELAEADEQALRETLRGLIAGDPDGAVRVEALESLAYLADEPDTTALIQAAYDDGDVELRASALRSMGRQADTRWSRRVLESMQDDEPELRFEAARAAGMIGGSGFVPRLIDLAREDEDGEVRLASIEALGEIGSEEAVRVLRELANLDDVAIAEAAEVALDVATLTDAAIGPPRIV